MHKMRLKMLTLMQLLVVTPPMMISLMIGAAKVFCRTYFVLLLFEISS